MKSLFKFMLWSFGHKVRILKEMERRILHAIEDIGISAEDKEILDGILIKSGALAKRLQALDARTPGL